MHLKYVRIYRTHQDQGISCINDRLHNDDLNDEMMKKIPYVYAKSCTIFSSRYVPTKKYNNLMTLI
jgi:hypothetical protein